MEKQLMDATRQRISEAVFLIGVGVSGAFGLWWPGVLVAFGIAWSTSLSIRRRYWAATIVAALLAAVPVADVLAESWEQSLIPLLVTGLGVAGIARAVYLQRR